jgi:hypothetical protein
MGGGGPSSTTQTTTNKLPGWALPYAKELLSAGGNQFLPGGQPAQMPSNLNQQVAQFTPDQLAAMQNVEGQTGAASNLASTATGNLEGTLSGANLDPNSNPYLQGTYNEAAQNLINSYQTAIAPGTMAAAQQAGAGGPGFGADSGFQQQTALNQYGLGQNLGNLVTNIYGGAYEQGIQNQLTAQGLVGSTQNALYNPANQLLGVGSLQQQQAQTGLNTTYANALAANQYPMNQLSQFANILGAATGGSGQQITVGPNPGATK